MNGTLQYKRYTWWVFAMVMLVIIAGGVVRMTQSGMGCPDWPTCFGRWIPPLSADQLPPDFEKYLGQQDIDHSFNVYHTWIEYINRLLGALLGVFIFIHFIWSFRKFRKTNRTIVYWSLFLLIAVGFQGWLGKKVVDANLAVVKITIHMLVALLIAAIPLLILQKLRSRPQIADRFLKIISVLTLIMVIAQIVLGTQVREQVDEISKALGYGQRELWIPRLDNLFILHRSFSWLLAAGAFLLFWRGRSHTGLRKIGTIILILVLVTASLGVIMMWYNIPALAQPLHLLFASLLALAVFSYNLRLK